MQSDAEVVLLMKQTNHDFQNAQILLLEDICCTLDYLVSAACGAVAGLIDIFFVGAPGESALGAWSDAQVDGAVLKLSKLFGWKPGAGKENSIASAIGFLEKKFKVNYDQRHTADVGGLFDMSTRNHHIKSLAHAPDIIGLFFSVLNQFTNTASFVSQGTLITVQTDTFELVGVNPISKLFCGIANWFGHILSDIAGSSGSRGSSGRGAGIATPFYELLQFCDFGRLDIGKGKQDLATLAVRAFQEGYDARFGIAAALPVLLCDVSIRLIWSITRYFSLKLPLKKCLPVSAHQDLWVMLLFGNGTLCLIDGVDAAVRSGGNWLNFFMRLNLIAWVHFAGLVLKEVCIRAGIALPLEEQIEAHRRITASLQAYLQKLEEVDIEGFEQTSRSYYQWSCQLNQITDEEELHAALFDMAQRLDAPFPWKGSFESFMCDSAEYLLFQ